MFVHLLVSLGLAALALLPTVLRQQPVTREGFAMYAVLVFLVSWGWHHRQPDHIAHGMKTPWRTMLFLGVGIAVAQWLPAFTWWQVGLYLVGQELVDLFWHTMENHEKGQADRLWVPIVGYSLAVAGLVPWHFF